MIPVQRRVDNAAPPVEPVFAALCRLQREGCTGLVLLAAAGEHLGVRLREGRFTAVRGGESFFEKLQKDRVLTPELLTKVLSQVDASAAQLTNDAAFTTALLRSTVFSPRSVSEALLASYRGRVVKMLSSEGLTFEFRPHARALPDEGPERPFGPIEPLLLRATRAFPVGRTEAVLRFHEERHPLLTADRIDVGEAFQLEPALDAVLLQLDGTLSVTSLLERSPPDARALVVALTLTGLVELLPADVHPSDPPPSVAAPRISSVQRSPSERPTIPVPDLTSLEAAPPLRPALTVPPSSQGLSPADPAYETYARYVELEPEPPSRMKSGVRAAAPFAAETKVARSR